VLRGRRGCRLGGDCGGVVRTGIAGCYVSVGVLEKSVRGI
jgi:hypothetical protein